MFQQRPVVDHHHNGCFFIHNSFELLFVLCTLDGFMEGFLVLLPILLDLLPFALEVVIPELIAILLVHLHVLVRLEQAGQVHATTLLFQLLSEMLSDGLARLNTLGLREAITVLITTRVRLEVVRGLNHFDLLGDVSLLFHWFAIDHLLPELTSVLKLNFKLFIIIILSLNKHALFLASNLSLPLCNNC